MGTLALGAVVAALAYGCGAPSRRWWSVRKAPMKPSSLRCRSRTVQAATHLLQLIGNRHDATQRPSLTTTRQPIAWSRMKLRQLAAKFEHVVDVAAGEILGECDAAEDAAEIL